MNKLIGFGLVALLLVACKAKPEDRAAAPEMAAQAVEAQPTTAAKMPPLDANNIVSIAIASPDHTRLVKALQAADYVTAVSGSGPLTVFAPTNAAFDKLPAGTLDELLKPEKVDDLKNILKYHATTSAYDQHNLKDGQLLAMSNGAKVTIHIVDGTLTVNDAKVIATIPASNGVVHVIDAVLLPPAK